MIYTVTNVDDLVTQWCTFIYMVYTLLCLFPAGYYDYVCLFPARHYDCVCLFPAGHYDCVVFLVKCGAEVNIPDVKGQTPLFVAVKNKHSQCVWYLLRAGADPNGNSHNICAPLYLAANDGYLEGIKVQCVLLLAANSLQMVHSLQHVGLILILREQDHSN